MSALLMILAAAVSPQGQCLRIHYLPDGTVERSRVPDEEPLHAGSASAHSHAEGRGRTSSHSSVSVSSSNGRTVSSSSSSTGDERRSVTITRNEDGCTIIIDERLAAGEDR
jgi:hypothetical protein